MKVLLDTHVVLDIVLERVPFVDDASAIWLAHEAQQLTAYISPITPINVFYVVRKLKDASVAREGVRVIVDVLQICPMDRPMLQAAYALAMSDFEDATQVAVAQAAGLDAIVTRNKGDYAASPIPVLSPAELLARLGTLSESECRAGAPRAVSKIA